jgi:hypothetical protein
MPKRGLPGTDRAPYGKIFAAFPPTRQRKIEKGAELRPDRTCIAPAHGLTSPFDRLRRSLALIVGIAVGIP